MEQAALLTMSKMLNAPSPSQTYVLIDAALCTDTRLNDPIGIAVARLPVPGIDDKESQSALPFLLTWPNNDDLRDWLLQRTALCAENNYGATWLRSRQGLRALAEQLGSGIAAVLDDGTEILLRIADSRVLPEMHAALDPAQRVQLFAGIEAWWYLDRSGIVKALPIESSAGEAVSKPATLVLDQAQLDQLLNAAAPDLVIKVLRDSFPGKLETLSPSGWHAFVCQQSDQARGYGLNRPQDLAAYCVLALDKVKGFPDGSSWQSALTRVKNGQLSWLQAIADWERS